MHKTVLISSHILSEMEGICSHLVVVDRGRVVAKGSVAEIRSALEGETKVVVRTAPEHLAQAEQMLGERSSASSLVVERDHIAMWLPNSEKVLATTLAMLVSEGIAVWEWRIESAGLEDLFLQLTKGEGP